MGGSGKQLAFADHALCGEDAGAVAVIDGSGNKRIVSQGWTGVQGIAWSPDDREIWFSAAGGNYSECALYAVNLEGRLRTVLRVPSSLMLLDISPSGNVLISRDSPRREARVLAEDGSDRDISWLNWSFPLYLTDDGSQLLFVEQSALGLYEGCVRDTKGAPPTRLGPCVATEFSPDEGYVMTFPGSPITTINLLPVKLGSEQSIPLDDFQCSWVTYKDRSTLLAMGSFKKEPSSLHLLAVGRGPEPLHIKGPEIPTFWIHHAISPEGKSMAGWDAHRLLRIYSLDEDVSRPVPGVVTNEVSVMWSADGRKFHTYRPGGMSLTVFCTDLDTGERTRERDIRPVDATGIHGMGPVLLSADLRACVYSYRRSLAELYLAEGL